MRPLIAALLTTASLITPLAAAPRSPRDQVIIRLYNTFGVSVEQVARAHEAATAILERADVSVTWRDCLVEAKPSASASDPCQDVLGTDEIVMRVMKTPASAQLASLGYSYVDGATQSGVLATVFADRVLEMAARAGTDGGRLLGRAIAHEVGHLLLGSSTHAAKGLMRALWVDAEVRGDAARDWSFSKREVTALHANLSARRRMERPAAVTAQTVGSGVLSDAAR